MGSSSQKAFNSLEQRFQPCFWFTFNQNALKSLAGYSLLASNQVRRTNKCQVLTSRLGIPGIFLHTEDILPLEIHPKWKIAMLISFHFISVSFHTQKATFGGKKNSFGQVLWNGLVIFSTIRCGLEQSTARRLINVGSLSRALMQPFCVNWHCVRYKKNTLPPSCVNLMVRKWVEELHFKKSSA